MTQEEMWTNDGPPIYLDATKIRVVKDGDADAAFLLVAEGGQIPLATAKQYGVTDKPPEAEQLALPETDATEAPAETEPPEAEPRKAKPAPATKLRETPDNKSGQG